jgi:hypothetical protein
VKEACAAGQEVDVEGNCVADAAALCAAQCGDAGVAEGGGIVQGTGLCECAVVQDADAACDATCRAAQLSVTLEESGQVTLRDPTTGAEASFDPSEAPGYRGSGSCSSGGECSMTSVGKSSDGSFEGGYTPSQPVLDYWCVLLDETGQSSAFCTEEEEESTDAEEDEADASSRRRRALRRGRRLQAGTGD